MLAEPTDVLITGANRGLGLSVARALAGGRTRIWAACRPSSDTSTLEKIDAPVEMVRYDAGDLDAADEVRRQLAGRLDSLDWLVNNAGIGSRESLDTFDGAASVQVFTINAVAPVLLTRALRPQLAAGPGGLVVNLGSRLGVVSIKERQGVDDYSYPASKAALHMLGTQLARDLADDGVVVVSQSPGWARTDMGGDAAPEDADDVGRRMVASWRTLDTDRRGALLDIDGDVLPFG